MLNRILITLAVLVIAASLPAPAQIISTVAGCCENTGGPGTQGYGGDGGPATGAELGLPQAATVDAAGNMYVADSANCLIRKVTLLTGVISTAAGTEAGAGTGANCGYGGDGGPATSSGLNQPAGVAVDPTGNLYIADYANCLIRKVTLATGVISTIAGGASGAGTGANCGYSGDGGPATGAAISVPHGVSLDSAGNLYIADLENNVIREVNVSTGVITTVAGTGIKGYGGDGGPATGAQLNQPQRVAVAKSGDLFIADSGNADIRKVTLATGVITTLAGTPLSGGYTGDGSAATRARLNSPYGVAVDSSGNIYIADTINNAIRKVTLSTGVISTVAGCCENSGGPGTQGYSGDGGQATSADIFNPQGIAVDAAGNLYITDTGNNVIRKVVSATAVTLHLASTPSAVTVAGGDQAKYSLAVSAAGTVTAPVTFACTGLPADASCAFTPSTVAVGGLPATVALTISTTTADARLRIPGHPSSCLTFIALMLPGLLLLPRGARKLMPMQMRRKADWLLLGLLALVAISWVGCCGAPGGGVVGPMQKTYTVSVTASATGATSSTATVTLTVTE